MRPGISESYNQKYGGCTGGLWDPQPSTDPPKTKFSDDRVQKGRKVLHPYILELAKRSHIHASI